MITKMIKKWMKSGCKKGDLPVKILHESQTTKYIVSFPKSGNTWIRAFIANLYADNIDFINLRNIIPGINNLNCVPKTNLNMYTSHYPFFPFSGKVLYIIRDPRSVAVSYFYYQKKYKRIPNEMEFHDFFYNEFLNDKYDVFGNWYQNTSSWVYSSNENKNFFLLKYEDMVNNEFEYGKKIVDFYELPFSDDQIKNALEKSSFNNLKEIEQKQKEKIKKWKDGDNSINFFRAGKTDEWKEYFDNTMQKALFQKYSKICELMNYTFEEIE